MRPEKNLKIRHAAANPINKWSCAAMLALVLAAAPLLPARAEREAHNGEDDRRSQEGTTTVSIPLSGIGVAAPPTAPKPTPPSTPANPKVKNAAADVKDAGGNKSASATVRAAKSKTQDRPGSDSARSDN
jgi:hypothetical protein